jgi:hypothetical protein
MQILVTSEACASIVAGFLIAFVFVKENGAIGDRRVRVGELPD